MPPVVPAAEVNLLKSVYVGAAPVVKAKVIPAAPAAPVAPVATAPAQGQAAVTIDTVATISEQSLCFSALLHEMAFHEQSFLFQPIIRM